MFCESKSSNYDWMHAMCKKRKYVLASCITARAWRSEMMCIAITLYSTWNGFWSLLVPETEGTIFSSSFLISKSKHSRRWLPFHHQVVSIQRNWAWGSEVVISPVLQSYPCVWGFVPRCNLFELTAPPERVISMWHLLVSLQNKGDHLIYCTK